MTTMDPRTFVAKIPPPQFNIDTDRDDWAIWKTKWAHYLSHSGISRLRTTADPEDDVDQHMERTEAKTTI
eukprot:TCALIF_12744-PA protein Name:"Protein of unknown function" AED:0.47 eAED:0.51 QI:0/-1/0/1/-1/1/1/0/69